ncbi:MAG: RDD family protein [Deltaproteobacteria bacterium]|nr:RDD family protein [Deltaproteobacteria bacterium]
MNSGVINSDEKYAIISGFWNRILAFLIDGVILSFVGLILGKSAFDFLARLGGWGCLLGFCIALFYFGLLNSYLGKGQTIGKRIVKIKVIDRYGKEISIARSFVRYLILGAPFFFNQAVIPQSAALTPMGYPVCFIIFGIGGAIIYLYIFNRKTRQSLHDLVVGTFVVKAPNTAPVGFTSIWRGHLKVIGIWSVLVICFSILSPILSNQGLFLEMLEVQKQIQSTGQVHAATTIVGKKRITGNGENTFFQAHAIWKNRLDDPDAEAAEVAFIVLSKYRDIMKKDFLIITVSYGYDIGISRAWTSHHVRHTPEEWIEILNHKNM